MARIKYTGLVESIRGSIGGSTFQGNAYGYTIKSKPNNVKPIKTAQVNRQRTTQFVAQNWKSLSGANRTAWNAYANNFPIAARLNADADLNGYNYFLKYNELLQLVSPLTLLEDPGSTQSAFTWDPGQLELGAAPDSLTFSGELDTTGEDWHVLLFATPPVPDSVNFFRVTPRFMTRVTVSEAPVIEFYNEYILAFGKPPAVGQSIGLRFALLRQTVAQMAFISTAKFEVVAA